jgi:hypothetical protein
MSRSLRFAAAAAALVLITGTGCKKKNSAPESPTVQGPTIARPGDTLTYQFTTSDPDGDSVYFTIAWGDGDSTGWSPATASDSEYTRTHSYSDSGVYYIQARAKDTHDAESDWSDSIQVKIATYPPEAPVKPIGPTSCSTGVAYTWKTKAAHPLHDNVSIQFYWDTNDTSGWSPMIPSNSYYEMVHTYSLPGQYKIAAQAKDAAGLLSPWSESLLVTVDTAHGTQRGAPHSLVLSAANDSMVRVAWAIDSTPSYYVVYFQETGTTNFDSLDTTSQLAYVHDPRHRTGRYKVEAVYPAGRMSSTEAPSSAPVTTTFDFLPELSVGDSGFYWNRIGGQMFTYTMDSLYDVDSVDFYISDFAAGFAGTDWYAVSPDTAPNDPGGAVPSGSWHVTMFSHLDSTATEDSILPAYSISRYRRRALMDSLPRLISCYTEDGHYALLYVQDVDRVNGTAQIESWFQLIPNLRLIEHQH